MTLMPEQEEKLSERQNDKKIFFVLWALCILGSCAILPYTRFLGVLPDSVSFTKLFLLTTSQSLIFFGIICWLSYLLIPSTDLAPFSATDVTKSIVYPGVAVGLSCGLIIYLFDVTVFKNSPLSGMHPPLWVGLLASLYGGINEEVLLRLFFFTLVYFIFKKIIQFEKKNRRYFLLLTNVIVAILFGIGHLPSVFKMAAPSSIEVFRVLLLNGIPGVAFGWLYCTRGLWAAITAHLITDLMIHVLLI